MRSLFVFGIATAVALIEGELVGGGLPQTRLGYLLPPGGQAGTTFEVRIAGEENLDYASLPGLVFSHPGITAQALADPEAGTWRDSAFRVTVAPDVPRGRYEVVLDGHYGASNPRSFLVEACRTVTEDDGDRSDLVAPLSLNEIVYGRVEKAADVDSFTFPCEEGRTVVVRCDADLTGSPLQPLVELIGPTGRPIGTAGGPYSGRALLAVTPQTGGEISLRVTDAAYRGGPDFAYRLTVTTQPVVTLVWPPAFVAGETSTAEVYGYNLPGGEAVEPNSPLVRTTAPIAAPADSQSLPRSAALAAAQLTAAGFDFTYRNASVAADPVPVFFAPRSLVAEVEPNDLGQVVSVPTEIAGRFDSKSDADRFVFEATKGEVLLVEAFAERYGSPADPVLTVERLSAPDGVATQRLVTEDDRSEVLAAGVFDATTRDPAVRFEAPEDGHYRVTLRDRYGTSRGGRDLFYRLSLRRPAPDFHLATVSFSRVKSDDPPNATSLVLRRGENAPLTVLVARRDGFSEPITVRAEGLPDGVTFQSLTIPPGVDSAPLVFSTTDDATQWRGTIRVVGEATTREGTIRKQAVGGLIVGDGKNRALTTQVGGTPFLSVVEEAAPFRLTGDGGSITASAGSQVIVPLRLAGTIPDAAKPLAAPIALSAEAKVAVDAKPFETGQNEQFARLVIDPKAPARSHVVTFTASAQVDYSAFPYRLKRAKIEQEGATVRLAQADEALKLAVAARDEAMKTAAAAEQSKSAAELAATEAAATLEERKREAAASEQSLAAAQAAATAAEDDAKEEAAKVVAQRTAELEKAREHLGKAQQGNEDASKQAAEAGTMLGSAKAALRDRENLMKSAEEVRRREEAAKKAADQAAGEAEKAATLQKIEYVSLAPPLSLTIAPPLAELSSVLPDGGSIKRGGTLDAKVIAKRVSPFAGSISLELVLPAGDAGLSAEPVSIGADQSEGVLRIAAAGDAPLGDVVFPAIRATFNAPDSAPLDAPVTLKVVP